MGEKCRMTSSWPARNKQARGYQVQMRSCQNQHSHHHRQMRCLILQWKWNPQFYLNWGPALLSFIIMTRQLLSVANFLWCSCAVPIRIQLLQSLLSCVGKHHNFLLLVWIDFIMKVFVRKSCLVQNSLAVKCIMFCFLTLPNVSVQLMYNTFAAGEIKTEIVDWCAPVLKVFVGCWALLNTKTVCHSQTAYKGLFVNFDRTWLWLVDISNARVKKDSSTTFILVREVNYKITGVKDHDDQQFLACGTSVVPLCTPADVPLVCVILGEHELICIFDRESTKSEVNVVKDSKQTKPLQTL